MTTEFMLVTFTLFLAGGIAVPAASRFELGSALGYLNAGGLISSLLHWGRVDGAGRGHRRQTGRDRADA